MGRIKRSGRGKMDETEEKNAANVGNNTLEMSKTSRFWGDFDIVGSSLSEIRDYILNNRRVDNETSFREVGEFHYIVYLTLNKVNGKIYVGQHKTRFLDDGYIGSGNAISSAIRKYGFENFERIVLFDFKTFEEMDEMEKEIVTNDFCGRSDTYNIISGGNVMCVEAGRRKESYLSDERRAERSKKARDVYYSFTDDERNAIICKANETRRKRRSEGLYKPAHKEHWSEEWIENNRRFQKDMYATGQWIAYNDGKTMFHNANGDIAWFGKDDVPSDEWIAGRVPTEEYLTFHRKIDSLMVELHSLGSNYTWREGDTIGLLKDKIEQFKKAKEEDERKREEWCGIFEFFKANGKAATAERFVDVESIDSMDFYFERYCKDEFERFKDKKRQVALENDAEFDRMKEELVSYGFDRKWEDYNFPKMKKMYDKFIQYKHKTDESVLKVGKIFDEFLEHGYGFVRDKYRDSNLQHKFERYLPLRYKQYVKDRYGKDIEVEENIYKPFASNNYSSRKKRTASDKEIRRREAFAEEKKMLIDELKALGSDIDYDCRAPIADLKHRLARRKAVMERKSNAVEMYEAMYKEWIVNGFKSVKEKFDYTGTKDNLKRRFAIHVKDYDKTLIEGRK